MRRLSLFIHPPVIPSLKDGLPELAGNGMFAIHAIKLDSELLPLLLEARPCVCIFSLPDPRQLAGILALLTELRELRLARGGRSRDPALRIILMAQDRHLPAAGWMKLGVFEIIIAPILPKALSFKLSRHYYKALAAEKRLAELTEVQETPLVETPAPAHGWKTLSCLPSDQPETAKSEMERLTMTVRLPNLRADEGNWVLREDSEGTDPEDAWIWRQKIGAGSRDGRQRDWVFEGDEPEYDRESKQWRLSGEHPKLYRLKPGGEQDSGEVLIESVRESPEFGPSGGSALLRVRSEVDVQSAKRLVYPGERADSGARVGLSGAPAEEDTHSLSSEAQETIERTIRLLATWNPDEATSALAGANAEDAADTVADDGSTSGGATEPKPDTKQLKPGQREQEREQELPGRPHQNGTRSGEKTETGTQAKRPVSDRPEKEEPPSDEAESPDGRSVRKGAREGGAEKATRKTEASSPQPAAGDRAGAKPSQGSAPFKESARSVSRATPDAGTQGVPGSGAGSESPGFRVPNADEKPRGAVENSAENKTENDAESGPVSEARNTMETGRSAKIAANTLGEAPDQAKDGATDERASSFTMRGNGDRDAALWAAGAGRAGSEPRAPFNNRIKNDADEGSWSLQFSEEDEDDPQRAPRQGKEDDDPSASSPEEETPPRPQQPSQAPSLAPITVSPTRLPPSSFSRDRGLLRRLLEACIAAIRRVARGARKP